MWRLVAIALVGHVAADGVLPKGWSVEERCLALPYASGYIKDKGCVFALDAQTYPSIKSSPTESDVEAACNSIGPLAGNRVRAYRSGGADELKQLDDQNALKNPGTLQTGFFFGAGATKIKGPSGNDQTFLGYLCNFADPYRCNFPFNYQFRQHCYWASKDPVPRAAIDGICADKNAIVAQPLNDDENKFIANMIRTEQNANGARVWAPIQIIDKVWSYTKFEEPADKDVTYARWASAINGRYISFNGKTAAVINSDASGSFGYWEPVTESEQAHVICQQRLEKEAI